MRFRQPTAASTSSARRRTSSRSAFLRRRALARRAARGCTCSITTVAPRPGRPLQAFDLRDVTLLEGPFKHATDQNRDYLLKLEPDRLLAWFRKEAGLAPEGAGLRRVGIRGARGAQPGALPVGLRVDVPLDERRQVPRPHPLHRRRAGGLPAGERQRVRRGDPGGQADVRGGRARRHPCEGVRPERRAGLRSTRCTSCSPACATRITSPGRTRRWRSRRRLGDWVEGTVSGPDARRRCRRCCAASTAA